MSNGNQIAATDRTIINNNNNTIITNNNSITTNNDKIVNSCALMSSKSLTEGPLVPSGPASLSRAKTPSSPCSEDPVGQVFGEGNLQNLYHAEDLPPNWDYIKIDLYDNASIEDLAKNKSKYKLSINIKKTGSSGWLTFMAGLNSPIRNMKRGLDSAVWDSGHYLNVRQSYTELRSIYGNAHPSKTYAKGYKTKGQTIEDLSVVMSVTDQPGEYIINLHYQEYQWVWIMRGTKGYLTPSQRKNNIIATVGVRRGNKVKNLKAGDLLG